MSRLKQISTVIVFLFTCFSSCATIPTEIDSLEARLIAVSDFEKIDVLNKLSRAYWGISLIKSLDYAKQALRIAEEINFQKGIGDAYNRMGNSYYFLDNYEKSMEYFMKSLDIREKINDLEGIAKSYNNIGTIYLRLNNYEKTLEHFNKAIKLHNDLGNKKIIPYIINNLGVLYEQNEEYEKAFEYYSMTLKLIEELGDKERIAIAYNNLAKSYYDLKNYEKSLIFNFKSLRISEEIGDKLGIARSYKNIGKTYLKLNDYNKVLHNLEQGLKVAKEIKSKYILQDTYLSLSEYYSATNDFRKAYIYHKLFSQEKESIFNEKSSVKIAEMRIFYDTENKEKEIRLLIKDNKIQTNLRNFLIIFSVLILVIAIISYNRFQLKKKTYILLQEKNKQLKETNQKLIVSEKNLKTLNATKDKFFSIIAHDLKTPFNALLGFSELLYKNLDNYNKEKIRKYSNVIYHSARTLFNLIENLLQWSGTQTGSIDFNPEEYDLRETVNNVISLLKMSADNKNINLYSEIQEPVFVYADKNIISTVIRNLLNNAIKFTQANGEVKITASSKNGVIEISVIDSGIGISKDNIKNLFKIDLYYSTKGTTGEKGTGLGLILCKEFIEKNGGEIWVESEAGKGSIFFFTLPKKYYQKKD